MRFQALRPTLLGVFTPVLALFFGLSPTGAQAIGVGRPLIHSTLGRPLDVSFPLSLADGEPLPDSCLRAEVTAGDARVPAGLLQLRIEGEPGQQRIRLQSQARIDEPALRITLALGCPLRLTREFNAIIDPPGGAAVAPTPAPPPVPASPVSEGTARLVVQSGPAPVPARPRVRQRPKATGPRLELERPEILAGQAPQRPAPQAADAQVTPELEAQITQLEQTVAELRAELETRLEAEAAAASAASAASATAAPLPASAAVEAFAPAPPPERVGYASPYRDPLTWLMMLGLSLVTGAAAFYGSRWRDNRARRELAYWRALHAAEGGGIPAPRPQQPQQPQPPSPGIAPPVAGRATALPDEGQHTVTRPQPRPMPWTGPPLAPAAGAAAFAPVVQPVLAASMQATQPMPVQAQAATAVSAELPIADELLDLQQQVDFLLLLGQHDAAADLLAARLSRGNVGAMVYLMQMELCQQRGEPTMFAELARRFEQRFGTQAPAWSQSLLRGRGLDASTSVIAHLQLVWSEPAVAMQMLQDLLARGAGPGAPSFELPAYRDLLTLYSVARDLFEAGLRSDDVDLMLPLDSKFNDG